MAVIFFEKQMNTIFLSEMAVVFMWKDCWITLSINSMFWCHLTYSDVSLLDITDMFKK